MENNRAERYGSIVTYTLIAINIIIWALITLYSIITGIGYSELIISLGAKVNSNIINGQYWRFISPIFLHGDITHLFVNCFSLYSVGRIVEKIFGHAKFLIVYLLAGIMGSLFSFMFSINPSIGASGAIFGLMGALLYFGTEKPMLFKLFFRNGIVATIVINLAYGFMNSGIDNYGHIGGLIGGFLASGIVRGSSRLKWYNRKSIYIASTLIIGASVLILGFTNSNNISLANLEKMYNYDNNQEWEEAAKLGQEALKLEPSVESIKIELLWMTAKSEAIIGDFDKAVNHAQMLAELSPSDGYYLLGIIYFDMGEYDISKESLLMAKSMNSSYSNIDELLEEIERYQ